MRLALSIQQQSVTSIHSSEFCGNSANSSGGTLFIRESDIFIDGSRFLKNSATQGGIMHLIQYSVVALIGSVHEKNFAKLSDGVASLEQGSELQDYHGLFIHNRTTTGGVFTAIRLGLTLNNSTFSYNQVIGSGGVIYILQSREEVAMAFHGFCNLTHNSAGTGGAIYAIESILSLYTPNIFL